MSPQNLRPPCRLLATIAPATGGSIVLLRVVDPPDLELRGFEQLLSEARAQLFPLATAMGASGLNVECVVSYGAVVDQILEHARLKAADLVIITTHARAGVDREPVGTISDRVVNQASAPVLLLQASSRHVSTIGKLLVPLDGSPGRAWLCGMAGSLAHATGAKMPPGPVVQPIYEQPWPSLVGLANYDAAWGTTQRSQARGRIFDILVAACGPWACPLAARRTWATSPAPSWMRPAYSGRTSS